MFVSLIQLILKKPIKFPPYCNSAYFNLECVTFAVTFFECYMICHDIFGCRTALTQHSIMLNVTWWHIDQSAKQLVVGPMTKYFISKAPKRIKLYITLVNKAQFKQQQLHHLLFCLSLICHTKYLSHNIDIQSYSSRKNTGVALYMEYMQ